MYDVFAGSLHHHAPQENASLRIALVVYTDGAVPGHADDSEMLVAVDEFGDFRQVRAILDVGVLE